MTNVTIKDVRIERYNEDMHNSAYIKTWMGVSVPQSGYESAGLPRGGGWFVHSSHLFSFTLRRRILYWMNATNSKK